MVFIVQALAWRQSYANTQTGQNGHHRAHAAIAATAMVADQDTDKLRRIQKGLKASRKPDVMLARCQVTRIRHFRTTLKAYRAK